MINVEKLLAQTGPGRMSNTAYDTAWVARLGEVRTTLSDRALGWVSEHQLEDGSWGAEHTFYYHDRVNCTLAAMIALTHRGRRANDRRQIDRGMQALERITAGATQGLMADPNGSTVGFEMIAPTLVVEAESLGILHRQGERILGRLARKRAAKLAALAGRRVSREVTVAHSAEMAGVDGQSLLDVDNLQEMNGSVGHSPSATAYFALQVRRQDERALSYLQSVVKDDGGAPNVAPFDVFEPAWVLWNLALPGLPSAAALKLCQPHLDALQQAWIPGRGVGIAAGYTPKDGDDTGLVYEVLAKYGRSVDLESVLAYEMAGYFRCFDLEADPSISANIHILGALRQAGYTGRHASVQKILSFLRQTRTPQGFWFDKWHASPYYATSHAVIACAGCDDELVRPAVDWLLSTQNTEGSWGFYQPTAEESAYALQALGVWRRNGRQVPQAAFRMGARWLEDHDGQPYPPLWIGKALYSPELVIESAIACALAMAEQKG